MSASLNFVELNGTVGNNSLQGGATINNLIFGRSGADTLVGGALTDILDGGAGSDVLRGGKGLDILNGGEGNDKIEGQDDSDLLLGGNGNDLLIGGNNTQLELPDYGNNGDNGDYGQDSLLSDYSSFIEGLVESGDLPEAFFALATELPDILLGGAGVDTLRGEAGFDILSGGAGADSLIGGPGIDFLLGSQGNDTLTGSSEPDVFIFSLLDVSLIDPFIAAAELDEFQEVATFLESISGGKNWSFSPNQSLSGFNIGGLELFFEFSDLGVDRITDFNLSQDFIAIDPFSFPLPGAFDEIDLFDQVDNLTEAQDRDALFTYNLSDGSLFYNANLDEAGFGENGGRIAILQRNLSLQESNFLFFYDILS